MSQRSNPSKSDFTEIFAIRAGVDDREFLVRKSVLMTSSSGFFNGVVRNGWKETHEKRIDLPETRACTLEMYVHWLYTGHVHLEPSLKDTMFVELIDLYALADYLTDAVACRATMDEMADRAMGTTRKPHCASVAELYFNSFVYDKLSPAIVRELEIRDRIEPMVNVFLIMRNGPWGRNKDDTIRAYLLRWLYNVITVTKNYAHRPVYLIFN